MRKRREPPATGFRGTTVAAVLGQGPQRVVQRDGLVDERAPAGEPVCGVVIELLELLDELLALLVESVALDGAVSRGAAGGWIEVAGLCVHAPGSGRE